MAKLKIIRIENEQGKYIGQDGKRYDLIYGTYAVGPRAEEFDTFLTLEEALKTYGLSEVKNATN